MSTRRLVTLLGFLGFIAITARYTPWADTWWHLATAQRIVAIRAIPATDPFSFTQFGQPWRGAQVAWLAQLSMLAAHNTVGLAGLNLWTLAIGALAFVFAWRTWGGDAFLKAFLLVLAAAAVKPFWVARPLMVGNLCLAASLWVLEDFSWGRARRLWLLPIIQWLWANSHGASFLGYLLWGVYLVDALATHFNLPLSAQRQQSEQSETADPGEARATAPAFRQAFTTPWGQLLLTGIGLLLANALSPAGLAALRYPVEQLSVGAATTFVQEWASPDLSDPRIWPFLLLLLICAGVTLLSARRMVVSDWLLTLGFAAMALISQRNIPLFALAATAPLSRHAAALLAARGWPSSAGDSPATRTQGWLNRVLLLVFALAACLQLARFLAPTSNQADTAAYFPVAAVDALNASDLNGNLFNSYNVGGYLIWAAPNYPVFIDGRADLHGDAHIRAWADAASALPGWPALFDAYDIRIVMLEPHWPLLDALRAAGWHTAYEDSHAVILSHP